MSNKSTIKINKERILELFLRQLDRIGYRLSEHGITNQFNRHNCLAKVIIEQQRLTGQWNRWQLKLNLNKIKLRNLINLNPKNKDSTTPFKTGMLQKDDSIS